AIGRAQTLAGRRRMPRPKRTRAIKHALKLIDDVGLSPEHPRELFGLTQRANRASELANRAWELSYELVDAQGNPMLDADQRPMRHWEKIAGFTASEWIRQQLDALFTL